MIGRLVKMLRVKDLGHRTHSDLTGPTIIEHRGEVVQLEVGQPLLLDLVGGKRVETTPVTRVRWLRLTASGLPEVVGHGQDGKAPAGCDVVDLLCEISTQNTVYRLTAVAGRRARGG